MSDSLSNIFMYAIFVYGNKCSNKLMYVTFIIFDAKIVKINNFRKKLNTKKRYVEKVVLEVPFMQKRRIEDIRL